MTIALDTLAYARRLREAGFSEQQAEAHAEALAAAMTDSLATKQNLLELETRIDARFARVDATLEYLEKHLDTRLAEQEKRLETRLADQQNHIDTRLAEQQERRLELRFAEQNARFDTKLSDLEHRVTLRMVMAIGAVSALVKLL